MTRHEQVSIDKTSVNIDKHATENEIRYTRELPPFIGSQLCISLADFLITLDIPLHRRTFSLLVRKQEQLAVKQRQLPYSLYRVDAWIVQQSTSTCVEHKTEETL
jgi:hypothetical protein